MADCDLCGRAEVTLVPVPVPSNFPAYRESGTWAGLCTRCVELCRTGPGGEALAGRCSLCDRTVAGLVSVNPERPSLSGPKPFAVPLCPDCIGACRSAESPAPGHGEPGGGVEDTSRAPRPPFIWAFR